MRRKNRSFAVVVAFFVFLLCIVAFVLSSENFEKNEPKIEVADSLYWNLKKPLPILVEDDSGIKFIRISISNGINETVLFSEVYKEPQKQQKIDLSVPKTSFFAGGQTEYIMNIEANDKSNWNFFSGNNTKKQVKIILDYSRPEIYTLANSYSISRGGSAAVVFRANDNALKDVYVQLKDGTKFKPFKFIKDNFYMAIIAWPAVQTSFGADIVAVDWAGNESKEHIRYYHNSKKYNTSYIPLKDSFIDGKISDLAAIYAKDSDNMDRLERMRFVNETLRNSNEAKIHSISTQIDNVDIIDKFKLNVFNPLKNGKKVANFADHRFYTYGDKKNIVSESWHLGLDLASIAAAPIIASNSGRIVFAGDNGIYGKMLLIDHGYGIFSLYAHCSSLFVNVGDEISAGDHIADTGTTGLALGDHLHFGLLIQGIEVLPQEWMDKKWINDNIISVLKSAKKLISER